MMAISSPQAVKLRRLLKAERMARLSSDFLQHTGNLLRWEASLENVAEAESQLDAYITSLTASAQTGELK